MVARFSMLLAAALASACAHGDARRADSIIQVTEPVIDIHRHASWPGADDTSARDAAIVETDTNGIVLSLLYLNEPGDVSAWLDEASDRFIGGPAMPCPVTTAAPYYRCFPETEGWPDLEWLESGLRQGQIGVLGEMLFVYVGVSPSDRRMSPYWELAARYDVPVAVHINRGPPPDSRVRRDGACCPNFDGEMGSPALLRPVLERHPGLRVILQHVGTGRAPDSLPFDEETFALLRDYPLVYLDMSILNSLAPAEAHERELRRLVDAGFGDRIMFGTDGQPADAILRRLEAIPWLTADQRRGILYNNAARFLRLSEQQIREHQRAIR
jgi:hypothetical protein